MQVISSLDVEIERLNGSGNGEESDSMGKRIMSAVRYMWYEEGIQDLLRRLRDSRVRCMCCLLDFRWRGKKIFTEYLSPL